MRPWGVCVGVCQVLGNREEGRTRKGTYSNSTPTPVPISMYAFNVRIQLILNPSPALTAPWPTTKYIPIERIPTIDHPCLSDNCVQGTNSSGPRQ